MFNAIRRKKVHFNIYNILTMDFRPFHALRTWKVHVVIFSFHATHFHTLLTLLDFPYVNARFDFRCTILLIFTHCLPPPVREYGSTALHRKVFTNGGSPQLALHVAFPLHIERRSSSYRPELEDSARHAVYSAASSIVWIASTSSLLLWCSIESLYHLFFYFPLAHSVLSWLQALMFSYSSLCPALLLRHARFGFSSNELCVTPRIFVYLLNLCKFFV